MTATALRFDGSWTGSPNLLFGGAGSAPPVVDPLDDVSIDVESGWQACSALSDVVTGRSEVMVPCSNELAGTSQAAGACGTGVQSQWECAYSAASGAVSSWQAAGSVAGHAADSWEDGVPVGNGAQAKWEQAMSITRALLASCAAAAASGLDRRSSWQPTVPVGLTRYGSAMDGRPGQHAIWHAAQAAMSPPPGYWVPAPVDPPEEVLHPIALRFSSALSRTRHLVFGRIEAPPGSIAIPILRTYIVINSATLVRLPGNEAVTTYDLSLSWDDGSWSVGWSATLPASELDAVMPESIGAPVELLATINGTAVRLLAETISRDRSFGDARVKVSGRGRAAWLSDPYASIVQRTSSSLLTAQQVAEAALELNGVPVGWSLDWQIADWLIPAGAWSHEGSHIAAVQRIAEAAGGYILGHRTAQTLHVRPRYPLLPWEWSSATPDVVIPADVATVEGVSWVEKPSYNRVFVSGEQFGVLGDVTRSGTAGDVEAPLLTDSLITAEEAARERGGAILADTGRQAMITLQMPVLSGVGILDLGQLVEYNDGATSYRGLVRSVRVTAPMPRVWQTLEIEAHA